MEGIDSISSVILVVSVAYWTFVILSKLLVRKWKSEHWVFRNLIFSEILLFHIRFCICGGRGGWVPIKAWIRGRIIFGESTGEALMFLAYWAHLKISLSDYVRGVLRKLFFELCFDQGHGSSNVLNLIIFREFNVIFNRKVFNIIQKWVYKFTVLCLKPFLHFWIN